MKKLFIAEKPSVAQQFAEALKVKGARKDGFIEDDNYIVTWCVGHLVGMSYPDAYDPALKRWSMDTIPFIPETYKYEVISTVSKQFNVVKQLLNREDVETIYVCTDSGREGEYIYRLVDMQAGVPKDKDRRRVWIDSQTEEEILRGIKEAKPLSEYDSLGCSAYLRAKEDYLMGINFSRALTLKYSYPVKQYLGVDKCVIAVGRVMTCVLGMIVKREREIRDFVPTPFYRVVASIGKKIDEADNTTLFEAEWKAVEGSIYFNSPKLYKENGFKERVDAEQLIEYCDNPVPVEMKIKSLTKKTEKKNPPMLYNLAELQNDCSRLFKISPTETLNTVQELYEKKMVTYPRTDARVLSTAISKEIDKNLRGLCNFQKLAPFAQNILNQGGYKGIAKSKYVNDKLITDHYAIIPTGQGLGQLGKLTAIQAKVYEIIARRFLSIFYPAAEYQKISMVLTRRTEEFNASFKVLSKPGYLVIADPNFGKKKEQASEGASEDEKNTQEQAATEEVLEYISSLRKGSTLSCNGFEIKEGKTSSPKRYTSGSMILAMENAGQLIEDEELREQIKGSGIGTSATRDSIITKLVTNKYINLNKKTQVLTPTFLGEIIYDVVLYSINGLLRADLTASWEKGLTGVADGSISEEEYMSKLSDYVVKYTNAVKAVRNQNQMHVIFDKTKPFYVKSK
ncbi:MAG: type IA DNA topoisomerase [Eubacterium sp.]|nr:type IA DNA topoisomerase [Eubacterium sp.]